MYIVYTVIVIVKNGPKDNKTWMLSGFFQFLFQTHVFRRSFSSVRKFAHHCINMSGDMEKRRKLVDKENMVRLFFSFFF
jgi:hypothetical protein